ncbi:hypothetical protein [Candidatus Mycoplasma haematohominis]|uniref:hypothetical protein n=1 Tax=Candidatus Mycoplasma haematohominis TaxID=1494318 RepID=UPI001C0A6F19|nr:hypothetical protein [Candidatus Mycoplasma haemohominis]
MDPIKGTAALGAGAVVIGGTGYGVYSYATHDPMPTDYVVLMDSNDKVTADTNIGGLYGNYLVAPYGKDAKDNKTWWEWSFRRWQEDFKKGLTFSSDFVVANVKYAHRNSTETDTSKGDDKSLNKVCKNVFEKEKASIETTGSSATTNKILRDNLWKYCSFFGEEPKTIKEVTGEDYGNNTNGKASETKYIGVKGNDKFWEARNKEFYADSGAKSGTGATNNGVFKTEHTNKKNGQISKDIREICKEAYSAVTTTSNTQYPEADITKFCTLDGK